RPHRLRFDTEALRRCVHHDRVHRGLIELDLEVEVGPAHDRRPLRMDVDVIEPPVAERWTGAQVLARADLAHLAGRDLVRIEDEDLVRVDPYRDVAGPRPREPRMP